METCIKLFYKQENKDEGDGDEDDIAIHMILQVLLFQMVMNQSPKNLQNQVQNSKMLSCSVINISFLQVQQLKEENYLHLTAWFRIRHVCLL